MTDVTIYKHTNGTIDVYASNKRVVTIFNQNEMLQHLQSEKIEIEIELSDRDDKIKVHGLTVKSIQAFAELIVSEAGEAARKASMNVYVNDDLVATTEY